jgi:hypothetical protein
MMISARPTLTQILRLPQGNPDSAGQICMNSDRPRSIAEQATLYFWAARSILFLKPKWVTIYVDQEIISWDNHQLAINHSKAILKSH